MTLIRFPPTTVNNLMTVTSGERLERYISERWGRSQGGIRALAKELHVAPDRLYAWFNGKAAPDTDQLAELAKHLKVTRLEILAAMDDVSADPSEAVAQRIAQQVVEAALERERAAGRLVFLPSPRRGSRRGNAPQP